jgi:hypothetical protein
MIGTDDWVEGETGPRSYILENLNKTTGAVYPENLTGKTVELILRKQNSELVVTTGNITVVPGNTGEVIFTPDPTDMKVSKSPLYARFRVTASGQEKFFPKGQADIWRVHRP